VASKGKCCCSHSQSVPTLCLAQELCVDAFWQGVIVGGGGPEDAGESQIWGQAQAFRQRLVDALAKGKAASALQHRAAPCSVAWLRRVVARVSRPSVHLV